MNFRRTCLALALASAPSFIHAQTVDEARPYGRVCPTVWDANAKDEALLVGDGGPGPGRSVRVHFDANTNCVAVLAAFAKADGAIAQGWRPVMVLLGEWEEQTVPVAQEAWAWTKGEAFELFVAFSPKDAPGAGKVRVLVEKLRDPKTDAAVLKLQARLLREELRKWLAEDAAAGAKPESGPAHIGGTTRGAGREFRWREHARAVNFSAEKPGVIVFRYDGAR